VGSSSSFSKRVLPVHPARSSAHWPSFDVVRLAHASQSLIVSPGRAHFAAQGPNDEECKGFKITGASHQGSWFDWQGCPPHRIGHHVQPLTTWWCNLWIARIHQIRGAILSHNQGLWSSQCMSECMTGRTCTTKLSNRIIPLIVTSFLSDTHSHFLSLWWQVNHASNRTNWNAERRSYSRVLQRLHKMLYVIDHIILS